MSDEDSLSEIKYSEDEQEKVNDQGKRQKHRSGKNNLKKKAREERVNQFFEDEVSEGSSSEESQNEVERAYQAELRMKQNQNQKSIKRQVAPSYLTSDVIDENEIQKKYDEMDQQDQIDDQQYDYEDNMMYQQIPGKNDPKIFQVEVYKKGNEKLLALQLLNKFKCVRGKDENFTILSVNVFDSQPGFLFIEADRKADVTKSIRGMDGIKQQSITFVQETDIPKIFTAKIQEEYDIKPLQFCLIKAGAMMPYSLDLGYVLQINADHIAEVQVVKRPDLKKETQQFSMQDDEEQQVKKSGWNNRPQYTMANRPKKDDNLDTKKIRVHCRNLVADFDLVAYKQDMMDVTGAQDFSQFYDEYKDSLILSNSDKLKFKAGDKVIVKKGEFVGLKCKILSLEGKQATIQPSQKGLEGEKWEVQISDISKHFKSNDHVQVINGRHLGITGDIIKIENEVALITTDHHNQIKVKCDDLIKSDQRNMQLGEQFDNLKRLDLIKMTGYGGVGIILQITKEAIQVLNLQNKVQSISKMEYDSKVDTRQNTFKTNLHDILQSGSIVSIMGGRYKGSKAVIQHIYKDVCFLFSEEFNIPNTGNIIIERGNQVQLQSKVVSKIRGQAIFNERQKQQQKQLNQLDQPQEKQIQGQNPKGQPSKIAEKKDSLNTIVGNSLRIKQGIYKGLNGTVKAVIGNKIKISIPSKMITVTIQMSDIQAKDESQKEGQTPMYNQASVYYAAQSPRVQQSPTYNSQQSPAYRRQDF